MEDANKENEGIFRKIFNLCESDPDAGLEIIRKALKETPELEFCSPLRFCILRAYQIKGVKPLLERPWVKVGIAKSNELRLYLSEENLNYIELALSEVKKIEELDPEILRIWGEEGEEQIDAMACILERCRPGRVQQILGRTKLAYFGTDRVMIVPDENILPPEKLKPFLYIPFAFPSIVKSALILRLGRDTKSREFIECMLFGKTFDEFAPEETFGEAQVGIIFLFDDGTFAESLEKG